MSLRIVVFHPTHRRYIATCEHTVVCEETPIRENAKVAADNFRNHLRCQGKKSKVRLEMRLIDNQGTIKRTELLEDY